MNRILPATPGLTSPIEIANAVFFYAWDEAGFLDGAGIVADGGWTAHQALW